MKIGELSRTAATPVETIRYYEREGLMPPAQRAENNYRVYGELHVKRLAFIRQCRALDMNLEEIRVLLKHVDRPRTEEHRFVDEMIDKHIEHVVERILALRAIENSLRDIRRQCDMDAGARCGVLESIEEQAGEGPAPDPGRKKNHLH